MPIITEYLNTRKPDQLIQILKRRNVKYLFDIRFNDYKPEYYKFGNMRKLIETNHMDYFQMQKLGNPSFNRPPHQTDFIIAKQIYLTKVLSQNDAIFHLNNIITLYQNKVISFYSDIVCLICYCDTLDKAKCHRFWLQEYLETQIKERIII